MSAKTEDLKQLNATARKALDKIDAADKANKTAIKTNTMDVAEKEQADEKTAEQAAANLENAPAPNTEIPRDIQSLVDRLDDMINKMTAMLSNENSLLRSRDYRAVAKNATQKNEYMRTYEALLKEFMNKKQEFKDKVPENVRTELLDKAERLQTAIKKNHFFLQSVHISAKRVAERITKAVQNKLVDETATYNNKGLLNSDPARKNSAVTDAAY